MSMAGPHGSDPDDRTTPGSEAYGHVGRLGPGDLAPDEERLLAAALAELRGLPVDELCDALLTRLLPEGAEDDVALVAVCLRPCSG